MGKPSAVKDPWDANIDAAQNQPYDFASPIPAHVPPYIDAPDAENPAKKKSEGETASDKEEDGSGWPITVLHVSILHC